MKQTNLLRPFDLEAAKKGDLLCSNNDSIDWTYIAGPDSNGNYILKVEVNGQFTYPCPVDRVKMKPLCWLEDRPVYPGDKLYWNTNSDNSGSEFTVGHTFRENGVLVGISITLNGKIYDHPNTGMRLNDLTWEKPVRKVKKSGWINVHSRGFDSTIQSAFVSHAFNTKELADKHAPANRAVCIHIEWEEEE